MGVLIVGECLGTTTRKAGPNKSGEYWDETSIVVLDGMKTEYVTVANVEKFRGEMPDKGDVVALDCSVRSYVRKGEPATSGHSYTAFGRSSRVEQALAPATV